jgi:hypothetical protein
MVHVDGVMVIILQNVFYLSSTSYLFYTFYCPSHLIKFILFLSFYSEIEILYAK